MKNNLKCVVVDDEPMAREILISYIKAYTQAFVIGNCKHKESQ